jgi:hypothetical protein
VPFIWVWQVREDFLIVISKAMQVFHVQSLDLRYISKLDIVSLDVLK